MKMNNNINNEDKEDFILIYRDKDSKKYKKYDKCYMGRDVLQNAVNNYNKNNQYNDVVEIVQDGVLLDIIKDYGTSVQYRDLITHMHDTLVSIENSLEDLQTIKDEIQDIINMQMEEDDNDR